MLLVPLAIVPVVVPLKVPEPDVTLSCTVVVLATGCGVLPLSCACTVTLNGTPTMGLAGTDEKTSLVAPALYVRFVVAAVNPMPDDTAACKVIAPDPE